MTPLDKLPEALTKAQNEQEYILSTGLRFADKINAHEYIELCEDENKADVMASIVETIQRIKDLRYITKMQILFYDNKITDSEYLKAYNEFLTNI